MPSRIAVSIVSRMSAEKNSTTEVGPLPGYWATCPRKKPITSDGVFWETSEKVGALAGVRGVGIRVGVGGAARVPTESADWDPLGATASTGAATMGATPGATSARD